jgi:hypothetical protein
VIVIHGGEQSDIPCIALSFGDGTAANLERSPSVHPILDVQAVMQFAEAALDACWNRPTRNLRCRAFRSDPAKAQHRACAKLGLSRLFERFVYRLPITYGLPSSEVELEGREFDRHRQKLPPSALPHTLGLLALKLPGRISALLGLYLATA